MSDTADLKQKLMQIIKERITTYYPKIQSSSVTIQDNHPEQKYHTSTIYQFDILKDGSLYKCVMVKKRFFNTAYNNDVNKDTSAEFNNLKSLYEKGLCGSIPRALDAFPQEGILISEKIEGIRLADCLTRYSYLPLTRERYDFLGNVFKETAGWLKAFHHLTDSGKTAGIEAEKKIQQADSILIKLYSYGFPRKLGSQIIKKMSEAKAEIKDLNFRLAKKHGDFQPMNIYCQKNKIIVMDIDSLKEDICIKDVCNFIVGTNIFNIRCAYSFIGKSALNSLIKLFLSSYYANNEYCYPALKFYTTLGLLEFCQSSYNRNHNIFKRKRILSFYSMRLKKQVKDSKREEYV